MKKENDLMDPSVALRILADSVGFKWGSMMTADYSGLGHLHDLWRSMYKDMGAIVCLEKYIADHTDGGITGSDFRPVPGFEKYGGGSHDA